MAKTTEFLGQGSANTFKIVIQLGSILAVVVVMWKRILSLVGLYKIEGQEKTRFNLGHVIVGIIPAGVFGVLFEDYIDDNLFGIETVIVGLFIGAFLMIIADKFGPKRPKITSLDQISYGKALKIGFIQCLSLWPGFSRSGATISGEYCLAWTTKQQQTLLSSWQCRLWLGPVVFPYLKTGIKLTWITLVSMQ